MKRNKIIVIGGGISGAFAALAAAEENAEIWFFSDIPLRRAPTCSLQLGINAALNTKGEADTPELHASETLECGGFLAPINSVREMCAMAPAIARLFDRMGVPFDRASDGMIELTLCHGSSKRRMLSVGSYTGQVLVAALDAQLRRGAALEHIRLFEGFEFLSLVIDEAQICRGIVVVNRRNMEIKSFGADAVVVCTGGYAGLFGSASLVPAPDGCGIAACYEAGAVFANPEFVQVRKKILPEEETFFENDSLSEIPNLVYWTLGGLWVDAAHITSIERLFAAGSAACAYHGARALEGNEFLSAAYGGMVAGREAARMAAGFEDHHRGTQSSLFESAKAREDDINAAFAGLQGEENVHTLWHDMKELMALHVAFFRDNGQLDAVAKKVSELEERLNSAPLLDRSEWSNRELLAMRRIRRGFLLAKLVVAAARMRDESRGMHQKTAFPKHDDIKWKVVTKASYTKDGPKLDYSEKL